jgi:CheY-like chemotaxis protein
LDIQIKLFLIDDDEDDRELFQIALEDLSFAHSYADASGGHEALKILRSGEFVPDVIFLDLNMPLMSGRECLQELKNNSQLAHIPVVIFSTSNAPADKIDIMQIGAIEFITKPSKTSELTHIIDDFITSKLLIRATNQNTNEQ